MQKKQSVESNVVPFEHHVQGELELFPVAQKEVDGVQMGVLSNGAPYLTTRGLARMCGVEHTSILRLANNWDEEKHKPRGKRIFGILTQQGHRGDALYIKSRGVGGDEHAYTDVVSMAILEYYAFDAVLESNEVARGNYRILARSSFREFIYRECGYDPARHTHKAWEALHARILLNDQIPSDYFSVFRESAEIGIHMITGGCSYGKDTVPDISIGMAWSSHWADNEFDARFGRRLKHPHRYPSFYPQSGAGPVDAWIYPIDALGEFRKWLYQSYLQKDYPKYVAKKVRAGAIEQAAAVALLDSVKRPVLQTSLPTRR